MKRFIQGPRRYGHFGLLGASYRLAERQFPAIRHQNRTVWFREEFRAPAGVRKSPRKEPAGHRRWLWGFRFSADVGDGATGVGKFWGECGQTASLRLHAVLSGRLAAGRGSVGVDDHHGHAWIRCRRLCAYGLGLDHAMPGHGAFSGFGVVLSGGPRGCLHRSKVSMMIMRPPQTSRQRCALRSSIVEGRGNIATTSRLASRAP